jgi:antirestriction protein ArdC
MTFRQVNERGGRVRKGEHGVPIMKWGRYDRATDHGDGTDEKKTRYFLRTYSVFNARQIDGIDFPAVDATPGLSPEQRLAQGEVIVHGMPQPPTLRESRRNRAAYQWKKDSIEMPPFARFDSPEEYYLTLFHELAHATGHPTRLDRKGVTESDGFGGKVYSQEELVAEMAAAFLGMEADLVRDQHEQSAAYLKGWLDVLQEPEHRRWLVHAANQGARAADFILGRKPEESEAKAESEPAEPAVA